MVESRNEVLDEADSTWVYVFSSQVFCFFNKVSQVGIATATGVPGDQYVGGAIGYADDVSMTESLY